MRSRSSIFSSRVLGSALLWSVLAAVLIEWHAGRVLPVRHPAHEVDRLLYDLDHGRIPGHGLVFLGDSVGRQIALSLAHRNPGLLEPLASNAAIETPGQYYVLQRYLRHHPAPRRVILMMGYPVGGQLQGDFTENYVQRGFLHVREILELAWARRSLRFGLVMAGYKLSPVFRHRIALQKTVPLLATANPVTGWFDLSGSAPPAPAAPHGLLDLLFLRLEQRHREPEIADRYFQRLLRLLQDRNIELVYLPPPLAESVAHKTAPNGLYGRQIARLRELAAPFPGLRVHDRFFFYPDAWFLDGTHLSNRHLPPVAENYADLLDLPDPDEAAP